jgi:fucose permease
MGEREPASRAVLNTNTVLAFLILGWGGGALGPALPWLAGHWGVRLDEAGALFTMNFLGACGTVALSGVLLDRVGRKPLLVAGALLLMMGLLGVGLAPSLPVALASALLLGLGFGCLDVTLNVFVADLYPGARDAALNLMNTAFGAGALVGPLSVGVALKLGHSPQEVLWGLSGIALLNGVIYLALRFPSTPAAVPAPGGAAAPAGWRVLRERYVLLLALLLFLYVGLEVGFGGWAYSFATQGAGMDAGAAALVVAGFWLAFTLGRLVAGVVARWVAGPHLVLGGAGLVALGAALIALFATAPAALFVGAVLIGGGCGPVFPTVFGQAAARYPGVGLVSSAAVLGGTLGGTVLPYVQGRLLVGLGVPVAAGLIVVLALVIIGLQRVLTGSWAAVSTVAPGLAPAHEAQPACPL